MIRAGFFDDVSSATDMLKKIGQWFSDAGAWLFAPINWVRDWWPMAGHVLYFIVFFVLCLVVGFFLPFKWVRAALFFFIIVFGAFLLGEIVDFRWHLLAAAAAAAAATHMAKPKPKPPSPRPW